MNRRNGSEREGVMREHPSGLTISVRGQKKSGKRHCGGTRFFFRSDERELLQ